MSVTATLEKPAKENIFDITAKAKYSCTASLPRDTTSEYHAYEYYGLTYKWTFSDNSTSSASEGTHTFTGLTKGAKNTISASLQVTCTEEHWTREDIEIEVDTGEKDKDGNPITETQEGYSEWELSEIDYDYPVNENEIKISHIIYTHPGQSTAYNGLKTGDTIQENLTSGVVAKWVEHCGKWRSWWFQKEIYTSADDCKVNSDDVITAGWFNRCTGRAEASSPTVSGGATGTVISADLFKQQDQLISRRE